MRCPACKKQNTMQPWEGPITRRGFEIVARGDRCSSCGDLLFDYAEMGRQDRLVVTAIVERGIRTGKDFKFVRKVAGLTAVEVAEMLDVRPETVSRWERGEIPVPRLAAFTLGELFEHPRSVRTKLEAFAR